jgi:hypothetical protein
MVDLNVLVRSDCIEQVEDIHLVLEHMIIKSLKAIDAAHVKPVTAEMVHMTEKPMQRL